MAGFFYAVALALVEQVLLPDPILGSWTFGEAVLVNTVVFRAFVGLRGLGW